MLQFCIMFLLARESRLALDGTLTYLSYINDLLSY